MSHPSPDSIRTPIAKVRGLGSAKGGTKEWWYQRVTAVFLVPLTLWFVTSLVCLATGQTGSVGEWLSSPLVALATVGLLAAMFFHAWLGVKVVIEDYVHCEAVKLTMLIVVKLLILTLALASVFAVCKLHFIGMPMSEMQPPPE
ncbi:MAG: succinate dehydrogenase, hydrophobic membrane anchor protein [Alphaproteobacteria bacterium]|nr:succinate dehydrogenase, hydrophobic membrane anchor protein [Alphaproteobacteria bacterium]